MTNIPHMDSAPVLNGRRNHPSLDEPHLMSRSLPISNPHRSGVRPDETLHSSQSLSGRASLLTYRNKQYPSATAALRDYISDYENEKSSDSYRRTVDDLLLPRTTLHKTVDRSLDTGVRDTRDEFHRYNIKKLIDESYEEMMRADLEQETASALIKSAEYLRTSSRLSSNSRDTPTYENEPTDLASEVSSSTDALLLASPYPTRVQSMQHKPTQAWQKEASNQPSSGDGRTYHRHLRLSSGTSPQVTARDLRISSLTSKSTPRSRSLPKEKQYFSHSTLPRQPHSSRNFTNSHSRFEEHSTNRSKLDAMHSVPSMTSHSRRSIPDWVANLDTSVMSQKSLATLYTDTLLSLDGHVTGSPDSHRLQSRGDMPNSRNVSTSKDVSDENPVALPDMDRAMSVMSGFRPPPSWIDEDLDTTVGMLPASLRVLAADLNQDGNMIGRSGFHSTQNAGRRGREGDRKYNSYMPASLVSDFEHNTVPQSQKLVQYNSQTAERSSANSVNNVGVGRKLGLGGGHSNGLRQMHRRTESTSTEDLINASPLGQPPAPRSTLGVAHHRQLPVKASQTVRAKFGSSRKHLTSKTSTQQKSQLSNHKLTLNPPPTSSSFPNQEDGGTWRPHFDNSTTTDSLIYSSPFGLTRSSPTPVGLGPYNPVGNTPIVSSSLLQGNKSITQPLRGEDLASISSISSVTLKDEALKGEPLALSVEDYISESTVGETARADAMLRRANRIMDNTALAQDGLLASRLLAEENHSSDSEETEELLAGDPAWVKTLQTRLQDTSPSPNPPVPQRILDQFLEDCLKSSGKGSPEPEEEQVSEGPLESLKNMLFRLQDLASQHSTDGEGSTNKQPDRHQNGLQIPKEDAKKNIISEDRSKPLDQPPLQLPSPSSSSPLPTIPQSASNRNNNNNSSRNFDEEPGGKSLQRAMKHLSRLKSLVAMDTASSSSDATAARASSPALNPGRRDVQRSSTHNT